MLAELDALHPAPDELLESVSQHVHQPDRVYQREADHHDSVDGRADAGGNAALHAGDDLGVHGPAGRLEKHSTKAYFNVTLPEKGWPAARTGEYMAAFNMGTIISTTVHEAYPGHYVQFLWMTTET